MTAAIGNQEPTDRGRGDSRRKTGVFIPFDRIFVHMTEGRIFSGEPSSTREAIMRATFEALQKHGYAGLSIQRIADEIGMSKSSFYYHFDDKDDLLLGFLGFVENELVDELMQPEQDDPIAELRTVFDFGFLGVISEAGECPPETDRLVGAHIDVRANAVYNDAYRERFTGTDRVLRDRMVDVIERGIERGVFRDVDVDRTADFLQTLIAGAMLRRATTNDSPMESVRAELDAYVRQRLLRGTESF